MKTKDHIDAQIRCAHSIGPAYTDCRAILGIERGPKHGKYDTHMLHFHSMVVGQEAQFSPATELLRVAIYQAAKRISWVIKTSLIEGVLTVKRKA